MSTAKQDRMGSSLVDSATSENDKFARKSLDLLSDLSSNSSNLSNLGVGGCGQADVRKN